MANPFNLKQELTRERDYWGSALDTSTIALLTRATNTLRESVFLGRALREMDRAPNFRLPSAQCESLERDELLGFGPVVILFYRGQWCPYCNLELRAFQHAMPRIRALGARVIAISPQTPDHSLSTAEKNELTFSVLSDVGLNVSRAFGIAFKLPTELVEVYKNQWNTDLVQWNGEGGWSLPIPATYVIDRDANVALAHVDPDYRNRLDPDAVLAVLRVLAKRSQA